MAMNADLSAFAYAVNNAIDLRAKTLGEDQDWVLPQLSTEDMEMLHTTSRMDWSAVDLTREARMRRGIAYLQRFYPLAPQFVNLPALDINSCYTCVLGQIWGAFSESLEVVVIGRRFCMAHGFWPMGVDGPSLTQDGYDLTAQWREWLRDAPLCPPR